MIKFSDIKNIFSVKFIAASAFLWSIIAFHLCYNEYFIGAKYLGHDYSYLIPAMIDNYFWWAKNGIFSPPWFSPAFCGGQANFPDPNSSFYSMPQFLLFTGIEISNVLYTSILLFAVMGFIGMYLLSKEIFKLNIYCCSTCAAIFVFNDFFIYRMIVGHASYQGFMLIPLISYLLINTSNKIITRLTSIVFASIFIAYWVQAGMGILIIPSILSIIIIALLASINNQLSLTASFKKLFIAITIAGALSASKLVGVLALLGNFPRTQYGKLSFDGIANVLEIIYLSLFDNADAAQKISSLYVKNNPFDIPSHEMAFSITFIPLAIISSYLIAIISRYKISNDLIKVKEINWDIILLISLLSFPIILLIHNDTFEHFIKISPIFSTITSPQRFLIVFIFCFILWAGISLNKMPTNVSIFVLISTLILTPIISANIPRFDYIIKSYPIADVSIDFEKQKIGAANHKITRQLTTEPFVFPGRNYFIVKDNGLSILNCYNPLYGYYMENLNLDSIQTGDPLAKLNATQLNIRNPSCLLYPKENNCKLWDNFLLEQKDNASLFVSYKPFYFNRSVLQKIADIVSIITSLIILSYISVIFISHAYKVFSNFNFKTKR